MTTLFYHAPFQSTFAIETDCNLLTKQLYLKYGKYISTEKAHIDYHIVITKKNGNYLFQTEAFVQPSLHPLIDLDHFFFENTIYDPRIFALHGGAIEWKNKCFIFLAPTTAGKTTLTAYLTNFGAGYITDDCILLDRTEMTVHPYATPLHLRDGGLSVLKKQGITLANLQALEDGAEFKRYIYTPHNCAVTEQPLASIFFIERTTHENCLMPMSATERMTEMMKAPITPYEINTDYLRFLARLIQFPCHRLRYCNMEYVKDVIQNECASKL